MAKLRFAAGLVSLLTWLIPALAAGASPDTVKWSSVNIPTEGELGNWVLAGGSDVQHLAMAADGTLYGYVNPSGTSYTLFKSSDSGLSWSYTGSVKGNIVDIATTPGAASVVYYATTSTLYKSTDGGKSFVPLPALPGGAGTGNLTITAIDVVRVEGSNLVAVGTRDGDDGQYGGVYILDEKEILPRWVDTNIGSYDVCAVAFSPRFPTDRQLVAVVTDEKDTFVTSRIGNGVWGDRIGKATIKGVVAVSAGVAFPDDYDATSGDCALFLALDSGQGKGDVYRANLVAMPGNSVATDLDIGSAYGLSNVDISTLAVTGKTVNASMMAGAASSAQVYFSADSGRQWKRSTKPPTGQSKTFVLMAPDFASRGRAYVATSGSESAFSITRDGGTTWNQAALIDTTISSILDLAVSPGYSRDNTLFMLTFGGKHSLWRSLDGGEKWERTLASALANVDSIKLVKLIPQYGRDNPVVLLAGASNGESAVWKSVDNGQEFKLRTARDPSTGVSLPIDTLAVISGDILLIASYNGSSGLVYRTNDGGLTYATGVLAGSQPLTSIALSPGYERDKTILAGSSNDGWVYWSNDDGATFKRLGQQLPQLFTGTGVANDVLVAFDNRFGTNHTVYAASHCYKGTKHSSAIYRFIIGSSTEWESIDSALPEGSMLSQLAVSVDGGTLYATNSKDDGGMERCLDPTYPLGPTFETVTRGLNSGATLTGLWLSGNRLWSVDSKNTKLINYIDSLAQPVALASPQNQAPAIGGITNDTISGVSLDWKTLDGATSYRWQLNYHPNFATVPTGFEGETEATSTRLPSLEPATTYYWRVRATKPVLSPWSVTWSFTTSLGIRATALRLSSPAAGASGVPTKPIFQWSPISGADKYELLVATDASFANNPVIAKTGDYSLPGTAWQCDVSLDYNTTYYWKVRGCSSSTWSAWSNVGAFITRAPPTPEPSPSPVTPITQFSPSPMPPTPVPSPLAPPQSTIPDWMIYLVGALVLVIILLLVTIIVLVVGMRRA